ncbi:hypothetical protein AAHB54_14095, partial [Bacillus cereus]
FFHLYFVQPSEFGCLTFREQTKLRVRIYRETLSRVFVRRFSEVSFLIYIPIFILFKLFHYLIPAAMKERL